MIASPNPPMPGMNSGINGSNQVMVSAFRSALMHQGLVALLILATLAVAWASLREWRPGLVHRVRGGTDVDPARAAEPAARQVLRLGFGLLWVFDGILQGQPAMAAGLPSKVIAPAAATSPAWVQHLVNWAGTSWSYHPIQAGAATVWIQVGIGVWLLSAARGPWSRAAGLASAGWGLVVWIFGEAFGGIFAPGLTVLFGAPGAALLYVVAGLLVAAPERIWASAATGRRMLTVLGLFLLGMTLLQAWPGRGYWQGTLKGQPGSLTSMVNSMSGTPQPAVLGHLISGFGSFVASHGAFVNGLAVVLLLGIGLGLVLHRRPLLLPVVIAAAVFFLVDWVLVEDLGFLGGLGTDPNSMIPLLLLVIAGYVALTRPAPAPDTAPAPEAEPARLALRQWRERQWRERQWREQLRPARLAGGFASFGAQGVLALWAVVLVLIGAAPMAMAQANPNADPIIAQAIDGSFAPLALPASPFQLTDQHGRAVSLASLRGKVVLLTFLDPVCTTDCPLIAQEMRSADQLLGSRASSVEMVAVAANPLDYTQPYLAAFDHQERLDGVRNWLYLTGPLSQLRKIWAAYGVTVAVLPGGQMIGHNDIAFVIDPRGVIRYELNTDPGPGTTSSLSSFAVVFAQAVERAFTPIGSSG